MVRLCLRMDEAKRGMTWRAVVWRDCPFALRRADFLHIARACMKDLQAESEATMAEAGEAIAQPPLAADAVTLRSEIIERFYSTTAGAGWGDAMCAAPPTKRCAPP